MQAYCIDTIYRYQKIFTSTSLLLKNYLSIYRTFLAPPRDYTEHSSKRVYIPENFCAENDSKSLPKLYACFLSRYSLKRYEKLYIISTSTQNLLVQKMVLSRIRYYVSGHDFYRRSIQITPKKLCRRPVNWFSNDLRKYCLLKSFYSRITCPKEGTFSPTGPC